MHVDCNILDNPADTSSFDSIFLDTDIAQGMVFKDNRTEIIHKLIMDLAPV